MAKISWKRNALFWGLFVSIIRGFVGQATRSDLKVRKSAFSTCLGKNGAPRPSTGGQAAASIQDEPGDCRADSERERSSWCGGGSGSCRTPPKVFALAQFLSRVEPLREGHGNLIRKFKRARLRSIDMRNSRAWARGELIGTFIESALPIGTAR